MCLLVPNINYLTSKCMINVWWFLSVDGWLRFNGFENQPTDPIEAPFKVVATSFHPKFTSWKLNKDSAVLNGGKRRRRLPSFPYFGGKILCSGSMSHIKTCCGSLFESWPDWWLYQTTKVVFGWFLERFRPDHQDVPVREKSKLFTVKAPLALRRHFGVTNFSYPVLEPEIWPFRHVEPTSAPDSRTAKRSMTFCSRCSWLAGCHEPAKS